MALEVNKYYLTDRGNEILRRAIGGEMLEITSVKLGTGVLPDDEEEARALTGLVLPRQSFLINTIENKSGQLKISVGVRNDTLTTGYYAREAGLYVKDPDTEEETLFAVSLLDGNFVPAFSGAAVVNQLYSLYIVIGDADVTIKYEGDLYQLKSEALTIDQVFPVGAIRFSLGDEDPNKLWPTTKWEKLAEGMALISAGDTYMAGTVYGSNEKSIKRENLPKEKIPLSIEKAGDHKHSSSDFLDEIGFDVTNGGGGDPEKLRMAYGDNRPWNNYKRAANTGTAGAHTHTGTTEELGEGKALNVMQASLSVYIWKRIA